tara:strand:+ start:749 stop:889 length:141 start_codon:yes stop_codon:yes gene_type:complete
LFSKQPNPQNAYTSSRPKIMQSLRNKKKRSAVFIVIVASVAVHLRV